MMNKQRLFYTSEGAVRIVIRLTDERIWQSRSLGAKEKCIRGRRYKQVSARS